MQFGHPIPTAQLFFQKVLDAFAAVFNALDIVPGRALSKRGLRVHTFLNFSQDCSNPTRLIVKKRNFKISLTLPRRQDSPVNLVRNCTSYRNLRVCSQNQPHNWQDQPVPYVCDYFACLFFSDEVLPFFSEF